MCYVKFGEIGTMVWVRSLGSNPSVHVSATTYKDISSESEPENVTDPQRHR